MAPSMCCMNTSQSRSKRPKENLSDTCGQGSAEVSRVSRGQHVQWGLAGTQHGVIRSQHGISVVQCEVSGSQFGVSEGQWGQCRGQRGSVRRVG